MHVYSKQGFPLFTVCQLSMHKPLHETVCMQIIDAGIVYQQPMHEVITWEKLSYMQAIACHEEIQPFVLPRACRYTPAIHIGSGVANGGPGWTWPVQFISEIPVSCIWLLCMQVTLYSKSLRQWSECRPFLVAVNSGKYSVSLLKGL